MRFLLKLILGLPRLSFLSSFRAKEGVADKTAVKEAIQIVLTVMQAEHADLEQTAVAMC